MITFEAVRNDHEVDILLKAAEYNMKAKGYTEHSFRHVNLVADTAGEILKRLGHDKETIESAMIAGYLHDIGNAINREDHAHNGAILAYNILVRLGAGYERAAQIMLAIGNHDELTGIPATPVAAALILADKSDVHRTRVNNPDFAAFDIHDRVNYAVESREISIDTVDKLAVLKLKIDTSLCPVIDYFEIFLQRMAMNKRAADYLGLTFQLIINETRLL